MTDQTLLFELGCEELPPNQLCGMLAALRESVSAGLSQRGIPFSAIRAYATPRRLALQVSGLPAATPSETIRLFGPPAAVAFDSDGKPTRAAEAFARKNQLDLNQLSRGFDGKTEKLVAEVSRGGEPVADLLPALLEAAIAALPVAKRMRWGTTRHEFARPVQWLVVLLGSEVVPCEILGVSAGRRTRGHRFHAPDWLDLSNAADYPTILRERGFVEPDFQRRAARIAEQVKALAAAEGANAAIDSALLEEVTALVEWPVALIGSFDRAFLEVPAEALISAMKGHQKYFHLVDDTGALLPRFIAVANLESRDPAQVVAGNEKVIRPRLADAAFFYRQDLKRPLSEHRAALAQMVFQAELGTLLDKSERIAQLAALLAPRLGADPELARTAGRLSKADLTTQLVYEFPELQGSAGRYYALAQGKPPQLAEALREQYLPRFAGDALPQSPLGTALALADRLDTLVGIFSLGQAPTGSKDPFGLRRASVAVLRLLLENQLDLDLAELLAQAESSYPTGRPFERTRPQALSYMLERLKGYFDEQSYSTQTYQAVAAKNLSHPLDISRRMAAVQAFAELPEAQALAEANKRVANILAKESAPSAPVNEQLLESQAERDLYSAVSQARAELTPALQRGAYTEALVGLAGLKQPVGQFFDQVMVMVDDQPLRQNRLALLAELRALFLAVADISLLAVKERD